MIHLTVRTESLDDFLARAKATAHQADQGIPVDKRLIISFENVSDLASVLTKERTRMLRLLLNSEKTVSELASELHRDTSAVNRDVRQLERLGLLLARMETNPGHGRHKVVRAVAPRIELSAVLESNATYELNH